MFAAYVNDKCMKIGNREEVAAYLKKYYRLTVEELAELFANWEFSFTFDSMAVPSPQEEYRGGKIKARLVC